VKNEIASRPEAAMEAANWADFTYEITPNTISIIDINLVALARRCLGLARLVAQWLAVNRHGCVAAIQCSPVTYERKARNGLNWREFSGLTLAAFSLGDKAKFCVMEEP
jgi:hypothetical protein